MIFKQSGFFVMYVGKYPRAFQLWTFFHYCLIMSYLHLRNLEKLGLSVLEFPQYLQSEHVQIIAFLSLHPSSLVIFFYQLSISMKILFSYEFHDPFSVPFFNITSQSSKVLFTMLTFSRLLTSTVHGSSVTKDARLEHFKNSFIANQPYLNGTNDHNCSREKNQTRLVDNIKKFLVQRQICIARNKETLVPLKVIDKLTQGFYIFIQRGYLIGKPEFSVNFGGIFKSPVDKFTF